MIDGYLKLGAAGLLPVLLSAVFCILNKKTAFGQCAEWAKQTIIGMMFGVLAIIGTEYGVTIEGAMMNCRDAAVLASGLLFGAPAGIIAGVIGGAERWLSVYWGVGAFTRTACSVSTFLAGIYSAALRKFLLEDKHPGWMLSFAVGIVMEVFHLTMVFLTNMNTPIEAMEVVRVCTGPMLLSNGLSVMLSAVAVTLLSGERLFAGKEKVRISRTVQKWLLVTVIIAFFTTSFFVFRLQNTIAEKQRDSVLTLALDEVSSDIRDITDENIISNVRAAAGESENTPLAEISEKYRLSELSKIDKTGHITQSTDEGKIGFDMASREWSSVFLHVLDEREAYVYDGSMQAETPFAGLKYAAVRMDSGLLLAGCDAAVIRRNIREQAVKLTQNKNVGSTGGIQILDEDFRVVSSSDNISYTACTEIRANGEMPETEKTVLLNIDGTDCYCRFQNAEGYYLIAILPKAEALQIRNIALYVNTFMEILVFAVLFALIYMVIRRAVVDPIAEVNRSLTRITAGELNEKVDVRTNEEFVSLSDDINATVSSLKTYIAEVSAQMDKELALAKEIQTSALPGIFPAFPKRKDFDIYALMDPAKEVGGDFYDFYMTDGDTLHFLIADVSGKGIPAAMFMMRAKTELKSLTEAGLPLSEVFTHGNDALCEGNDAGMFVTAWEGSIDLKTGNVRFVNAGHNPPLIRHADGSFAYFRARPGFVLAGMEGVAYKSSEFTLASGDILFLYTDGVTEAQDKDSVLYGEKRLEDALNVSPLDDMKTLCEAVKEDVDCFVGGAPQFDDITMLALRYLG